MQQKTPLTNVKGDRESRGTTLVRRSTGAAALLRCHGRTRPHLRISPSAGQLRGHVQLRSALPLSPDRALLCRFAPLTLPIIAFCLIYQHSLPQFGGFVNKRRAIFRKISDTICCKNRFSLPRRMLY